MILKTTLVLFGIMGICTSCYFSLEATIIQKPSELKRLQHRQSHYSTSDGGAELVGTITETYTLHSPELRGDTVCISRTFKGENSRYYHKHSLPQELSHRVPITYCAVGTTVVSIDGFETFNTNVVNQLPIPDRFRNELRKKNFTEDFNTTLKGYYSIQHMFRGTFPVLTNVTARLGEVIQSAPFPIDSVITGDLVKTIGLKTMPFTIYYSVTPLYNHLMLEQLVAAAMVEGTVSERGIPFKNSRFVSASGKGVYTIWVDVATGDVVKEVDNQSHINHVIERTTGEELTFTSIQYTEVLYETILD
ncbi:MAG: hypothetical protein OCD01_00935 [Fibrobacterales bacterium]